MADIWTYLVVLDCIAGKEINDLEEINIKGHDSSCSDMIQACTRVRFF